MIYLYICQELNAKEVLFDSSLIST